MQENKIFFIYKITNLITSKIYIGKSIDPEVRFKKHIFNAFSEKLEYNECPKLYNSIRKYGIENFKLEIMENFESEELAYAAEEKYVIMYNSIELGYNILSGGIGAKSGEQNPMYGKGYLIAGDKNGMHGRLGELNPFFGKTHSKETMDIIKKANRKYSNEQILDIRNRVAKGETLTSVSKYYNCGVVAIHRIANKKRYADVDGDFKYSENILTDQKVIEILNIWKNNGTYINNKKQIRKFYDEYIRGKFPLTKNALVQILNGVNWKHIPRN